METQSRGNLGHRTAVALLSGRPKAARWYRQRGIPAVWRQIKAQLPVRPRLAEALAQATTLPGVASRQALAAEFDELFVDDPALADLVYRDLEDEQAVRLARATRIRRWTTKLLIAAVVFLLAWFTIQPLVTLNVVDQPTAQFTYKIAFGLTIVVLALRFLYRRVGRFASLINWLLLLSMTGAMVATLRFTDAYWDVQLAKILTILVLTVLPGWLYFQFVALRGRTIWEDYVLNLFRLHVDEPGSLPEPPKGTKAHRLWRQAGPPSDAGKAYRDKFEAAHGKVVLARHWDTAARRRHGDGFAPVVLQTLLMAFGWTAILLPFYGSSEGAGIVTIGHVAVGGPLGAALAFGFMGAYWFNLQSLVRRYFQNDLRVDAYISSVMRLVVVLFLVAAIHPVWPASAHSLYAVAFLIGVFPRLGLQLLEKAVAKVIAWVRFPELRNPYPLTQLDGLNMWYEARLVEEGIEDMQNLATADMVDLLLSTRVPVGRCVDWIDQALLYLRIKDPEERDELRRLGIRTATDLQDAFPATAATVGSVSFAEPWRERAEQVASILYPNAPDPVTAVDLLLSSFKGEVNLRHARSWREWRGTDPDTATATGLGSPVPAV